MDSKPDHLMRIAALLAVAITAIAWWHATGLRPLWWLAWLAALPLLMLVVRVRTRFAALATALSFTIGNLNQWHYLHEVVRLPLAVSLIATLMPALALVPPVLLWRQLLHQGRPLAATFSLPLTATGMAWLAAAFSPHGTFGNLAYTQMEALPVIQTAALLGAWGVGFIVWLLPAMLAAITYTPTSRPQRIIAAAIGSAVLGLVLGFGSWRLHADAPATSVRIGLVSIGTSDQAQTRLDSPAGKHLLGQYLAEINTLANAGARIIVAPESALLVHSPIIPPLQQLADQRGIRILMGVEDHSNPQHKHNTALVFEPAAQRPVSYFKQHLIPGFEDRYTPGAHTAILAGTPRIGMAICKDLDFTATGLAHGQLRTQLLLVPAWDFGDDAWLHSRMAILRGVENGFAIARSARDGLLTLSDDRGRVLAQVSSAGRTSPVHVAGDLPLRASRTPYTQLGDSFGVLCLVAAGFLACQLAYRQLRGASLKTS